MADITQENIDTLFARNAEKSARWNLNPMQEMHKRQRIMADNGNSDKAAFIDIYPWLSAQGRDNVLGFLSMQGDKKQTVGLLNKDKSSTRDTRIMGALNHSLASIIQDDRHKAWHAGLVNTVMDRLINQGIEGKYFVEETALPKAMDILYGGFEVWKTNAPVNIAFPKYKIQAAGVDMDDWEGVQDHMFMMLHQKYGGKISFVPRSDVLGELKKEEIALSKWIPYSKDNKNRYDMRALGTNRYNAQWNAIQRKINAGEGSSIQFGFINASGDPTKVQGIIIEHMRNGEKRIIGDMLGLEYDNASPDFGHYVPANFSVDNSITMMQSQQAWQKANSGDDVLPHSLDIAFMGGVWDGWDVFTAFGRWMQGVAGKPQTFGEAGGDFSREAILNQYKWTRGHWEKENGRKYRDWPSWKKGADGNYGDYDQQIGKGYAKLAPNTFGGKYLTEIFAAGQTENDLFFQPLAEELMAEEERLGRKMKDREIWDLYQIVKGRLNGKPDFWSGMLDNRVTDMLFQGKGWYDPDEPDDTPRTLFDAYVLQGKPMFGSPESDTPIADFFGRTIRHFGGQDAKDYYDLWRLITMPSAGVHKNTNMFRWEGH